MSKKFKAVYSRYHQEYEEEFDTAKEAAQFLYDGEMAGNLSYTRIIGPDGLIVAERDGFTYDPLYALGVSNE